MLIKDEHHSSVLTLPRSQDRCAADGAPDNRRLGSAGCWNDPDKTSKKTCSKEVEALNRPLHQLLNSVCAHKAQILRFADLVVLAGWLHPFPFRTRP
jgi:hypothetical protein